MRRESGWWLMAYAGAFILALALAGQARAASHHARRHYHSHHHRHHRIIHRRAPVVPYHSALLEDAGSGKVLYADNADLPWPPASMAKMMLLLVTERQIQAGRLSLDSPVVISRRAADTGGSGIPLHPGQVFPLGELIKAALIPSANDAAVAIAQKVGNGSVEKCVRMMNEEARALGLTHTHYETPDGLPPTPGHDVDVTDAYDLAELARVLIHTTELLRWSRLETCPFDHGLYLLHNTNHLIGHFEGCDGLKTGFTFKAGFNLTATAKRGDLRLVSIVLGAPSNAARFHQSERLLDWGFDHWTVVKPLRRGEALPVLVRLPSGSVFHPVVANDVRLVVRKNIAAAIKVTYKVPTEVRGPLPVDATVGKINVRDGERVLAEVAAVSPVAVGQSGTIVPAVAGRSTAVGADDPERDPLPGAAIRDVLKGAR